MNGEEPSEHVFFYAERYKGGMHRFEWMRVGRDSAVFLLKPLSTDEESGS